MLDRAETTSESSRISVSLIVVSSSDFPRRFFYENYQDYGVLNLPLTKTAKIAFLAFAAAIASPTPPLNHSMLACYALKKIKSFNFSTVEVCNLYVISSTPLC